MKCVQRKHYFPPNIFYCRFGDCRRTDPTGYLGPKYYKNILLSREKRKCVCLLVRKMLFYNCHYWSIGRE